MTALTTAPSTELRCPKYGNDGNRATIRHLVDVVCQSEVVGPSDGAVLRLGGPLCPIVREPHNRPRFECGCGHRWPVAHGIARVTQERRS